MIHAIRITYLENFRGTLRFHVGIARSQSAGAYGSPRDLSMLSGRRARRRHGDLNLQNSPASAVAVNGNSCAMYHAGVVAAQKQNHPCDIVRLWPLRKI